MIINKEFFFRGWLPAGLLVNARLLTSAPERSSLPVLKPVINPLPGVGWPTTQPAPVFPIEQATADTAIILMDPLSGGAPVLTVFPEWLGDGTPFIIAVNTWYEGRIRSVSGSDVMGVRIMPSAYEDYYSQYSAGSPKDVRMYNMPCHHLLGRDSEQVLLVDPGFKSQNELGYPPMIASGEEKVPARLMDVLRLTTASFAGMFYAYKETNPGTQTHAILCTVEDGRLPEASIKKVALALAPKAGRQKYYSVTPQSSIQDTIDVIRDAGVLVTASRARSATGSDQVVHYN